MVSVVVFEFRGMRCQPLRRALGNGLCICISMYYNRFFLLDV
ncbi:TPA: acetyltransferase [Vibrio cholerae]|nr:acetyltransferase [Vibrio cholerae]